MQHVGGSAPSLAENRFLLSAAVRNLLENALQASPAGGCVQVVLRREGAFWVCAMFDRWPGITAPDRVQITNSFLRGSVAQGQGSGLGLAIVTAAMARMGGSLRIAPREGGAARWPNSCCPIQRSVPPKQYASSYIPDLTTLTWFTPYNSHHVAPSPCRHFSDVGRGHGSGQPDLRSNRCDLEQFYHMFVVKADTAR